MISIGQLDDWVRGLDSGEAARAILAIGIHHGELGRARADAEIGRLRTVSWTLTDEGFRHRASSDPRTLHTTVPPGQPLRLAVRTDVVPVDMLRRLLAVEDVESAFVAVDRPAGSLRRRPWHWPLRIGLIGFPESAADEVMTKLQSRHQYLSRMLDVRRIEDEPGAVDVAVVQGSLARAVEQLRRLKAVANAVVVLDSPIDRSPLLEAHLATARAATAAVASALVPPRPVTDLLRELVFSASHAMPFDVALTQATGRDLLLWAEPDAMTLASVPEIALHTASELELATSAVRAAPAEFSDARAGLRSAALGAFAGESHEATTIMDIRASVEPELEVLVEERWCQAYVGEDLDNVIRHGRNLVYFFIGPPEEDALQAAARLDETALPWEDERAEAFRLTVLFVPAVAQPSVQQAELELPRFGRSPDVSFELTVDESVDTAAARIVVLFRNRVLQTAVLSGRVGQKAGLNEVAAVVPTLSGLDDRRPFDVALFANHTNGLPALIRHSNGQSFVSAMPGLAGVGDGIADELANAARLRSTSKGLRSEPARQLLVALATHGRELYNQLEHQLSSLADAERIQVVTARGGWFLPIELAYPRYSPDDDAAICENYLEDPSKCDGACGPENDRKSLCPNAFWGLSKTIERFEFDPALDSELHQGYLLLSVDQPRRGRRNLVVERGLLGASARVKPKDRDATAAVLGAGAAAVTSWGEWTTALSTADTQLLVLLPHTDYNKKFPTLEIADDALKRAGIEQEHVLGDRKVHPIVVLFGCRTTGKADDPAGFAARFMQKGARAVFHSSTDLLTFHASELAQRLSGQLIKPGRRPELLSDVLTTFRRQAVHDGLIAALAISAFGDADWRI